MKKFGKINLIFEFSISKWRQFSLCDNFHGNLRRKKFDTFFKTFFTNRGKNEDVNEKFWEN